MQHGSGTGQLKAGTAFHSLEGLLSLRLNSRTRQSPSYLPQWCPRHSDRRALAISQPSPPCRQPARLSPGLTCRWKTVEVGPLADERITLNRERGLQPFRQCRSWRGAAVATERGRGEALMG